MMSKIHFEMMHKFYSTKTLVTAQWQWVMIKSKVGLTKRRNQLSFSCQRPQLQFLNFFFLSILICRSSALNLHGCRFGKSKVINVRFVNVLFGFVSFTTSNHLFKLRWPTPRVWPFIYHQSMDGHDWS